MKAIDSEAVIGKRERRKATRRDAILEIAEKIFFENGYERTTMSSVAEAMGGSKGTLWSYFDSKEILFEAVIDRASENFRFDLTAALDHEQDGTIGLACFAETFIQKITQVNAIALQRIVIGEGPRFPSLGPMFYAHAPGVTRELLTSHISKLTKSGSLQECDPTAAAQMLLSLCSGGHHQRVLWGIEPSCKKTACAEAKTAVDHFLRIYGIHADQN